MFQAIRIENVGLFRQATIEFSEGFTVITGESGSGKSLSLDAIELGLGARFPSDMMGPFADHARIRLTFQVNINHPVWDSLLDIGLERDEVLIVQRDITREGRSVFRAQGLVVPAAVVKGIAVQLVDISAQHKSLALTNPSFLADWLDHYANLMIMRNTVTQSWQRWKESEKNYQSQQDTLGWSADVVEEKRRTLDELKRLDLDAHGDADISNQLARLRSRHKLVEGYEQAARLLDDEDNYGIIVKATQLKQLVENLLRVDPGLSSVYEMAEQIETLSNELHLSLHEWVDGLEIDMEVLDRLELRADILAKMKRKYDQDVEGLIALQQGLEAALAQYDSGALDLAQLAAVRDRAKGEYDHHSAELSQARIAASDRALTEMLSLLNEMEMPSAQARWLFESGDPSPVGVDRISLLFSANVGQAPKSLAKVASGGELSRVALALSVLGGAQPGLTLIFDELDAGLGGQSARQVGHLLKTLGQRHQVIAVSHQPTVASQADTQWMIQKTIGDHNTESEAIAVEDGLRENEIARMLSGKPDDVAVEHARRLLLRED